jgi:hypothetical protein
VSARRKLKERADVLSGSESPALTPQETDAAIFGFDRAETGKLNARPISIFEIYPDALQPRRAIPSPVRLHWDGRPSTTAALFSHWHLLAKDERGQDFSIEPYILAMGEVTRPEKVGPIDSALLDVIELAANIRSNGLTNPITVVRAQQSYRLETGERRWLAYHLLYLMFENEQDTWGRIPARVVDEFSVWRQAGENNARANLNAVSKARQLAILLMSLHGRLGAHFLSYDEIVTPGGYDRLFYAQVAEGQGSNAFPVPHGYGETVLNAMGLKQHSQIREYRDLLRLPDEVWRLADDLNWTQGKIRDLKRKSGGDNKLLISLATKQAKDEGYKVGILVEDLPPLPQISQTQPEGVLLSADNKKRLHKMWRFAERVGERKRKLSQSEFIEIKMVRDWLTELERAARERLKDQE